MRKNPKATSSTARGVGYALAVAGLLGLAALPFWAGPAEAGIVPSTAAVVKSTASYSSGAHKITVWRYEPKAKGKHPALVMLYGMDCLGESPARYEFVAQRFAAKGYVVHFVHYFDCTRVEKKDVTAMQGRIKASLQLKDPTMPDEQVRQHFLDWVAAVKAGVLFCRAQDNVDSERVCVVGFSLGGFVAMSLLATEPDLKLAAAIECFGGLPRELYQGLKSAPPVLIFHGDRDDIVPVKEAYDLKALLKDRKCHVEEKIFAGVGHMFMGDNGSLRLDRVFEAESMCLAFLEKHVKNGGKKKAP
jgi:dienelactone hydrolase